MNSHEEDIGFVKDALTDGYLFLIPGGPEDTDSAALDKLLVDLARRDEPLKVKLGIDPTGSEIHLGHSVVLRRLREFQDAGHKVILIVGTFTAAIGDPTGRDKARPPLDANQIAENERGYFDQVGKILDTSADKLEIHRNGEWFDQWDLARGHEFLSDYTLADLFNAAKYRLRDEKGEPIYLHELVYRLLQGWDSVELGSHVELGGQDQRLNCLQGRAMQEIEAVKSANKDALLQVVLLAPLLRGTNGEKMSKSKHNVIALGDAPELMFDKLMKLPDVLVKEYLLLLSTFSTEEKRRFIEDLEDGCLEMMDFKVQVASNIVAMVHGKGLSEQVSSAYDLSKYEANLSPVVDENAGAVEDGKTMYGEIVNMPNEWIQWYLDTMLTFSPGESREDYALAEGGESELKRKIAQNVVERFYGSEVAEVVATSFAEKDEQPLSLGEMEKKYVDEFHCLPTLPEGAEGMEVVLPEGGLEALEAEGRPLNIKLRIHPKRPNYHLGHVAVLKRLREFQNAGHRVTIVMDDFGATAPISTRRENPEDQPLNESQLNENIGLALGQISMVLDMSKTNICRNSEWLQGLTFREMIKLLSRHTLQELLGPPHHRTELGRRYDNGERIYMDELLTYILHGYDSVQIDSDIEVGFQDKALKYWMGRTCQQVAQAVSPQVLVLPPVLPAKDGKEMGSELRNAIWMTDTSVEMFDKLMAIKDEDIIKYVDAFISDQSKQLQLKELISSGVNMEKKRTLVREIVGVFYGEESVQAGEAQFQARRVEGQAVEISLNGLSLNGSPLTLPCSLVDLLEAIGTHQKKGWKRGPIGKDFVAQGQVELNGGVVTDKNHTISDLGAYGLLVKVGKKNTFQIV